VHDSSQGAQIFSSDTLLKIPNATIPYEGPRIAIPILYLETGNILVGEKGDISVYNSEGLLLGVLGVKAGDCVLHILALAAINLPQREF
jgi:hypothetical protein